LNSKDFKKIPSDNLIAQEIAVQNSKLKDRSLSNTHLLDVVTPYYGMNGSQSAIGNARNTSNPLLPTEQPERPYHPEPVYSVY